MSLMKTLINSWLIWIFMVFQIPTKMMVHIRREKSVSFLLLIILFLVVLYYQHKLSFHERKDLINVDSLQSNALKFRIADRRLSPEWFGEHCFKPKHIKFALENLPRYIENARQSNKQVCKRFAFKFDTLFRLEEIFGSIKISEVYLRKINLWLRNDSALIQQIKNQRVIKIYNRFTHEEMLYNYMRSQRPQAKSEQSPKTYTYDLIENSRKSCDFCGKNYLNSTAEDSFGRLEHKLSYTAANTFKYDHWHTLIVSRNHDTLHLTEEEVADMFELAKKWFAKAYSIEPMYTCPEMIWDAMPKSGASQIHTHLQVSLGNDIYYGNIERIRQGARHYASLTGGRNYFNDYLSVHQALGLTIPIGKAQILVHLNPIKDLEVMIFGEELESDFYKALHLLFRTFVDDLEEYSFSFGMHLPPMNESSKSHEMPVVCRLLFRNPVTNLRTDMNGLDLYTSSVVGKDRYVLYEKLKQGISKRYQK